LKKIESKILEIKNDNNVILSKIIMSYSRINFNRDQVWFQIFYYQEKALCPICKKVEIHKQKLKIGDKERTDWHIGHIIPYASGSRDIYPNVMPICIACNSLMRDDNLYDFCVKIGSLSAEEAKQMKKNHNRLCKDYEEFCTTKKCDKLRQPMYKDLCKDHFMEKYYQEDSMEID